MKEKLTKYLEIVVNWLIKYFNWINESNRGIYIFVGTLLFIILKAIGFADFICLTIVFCAAIIKELYDSQINIEKLNINTLTVIHKFDWLDILATIILPIIISILI